MVINSVSIVEKENIQVSVSNNNRVRAQSVPVRSVKSSPTRSHRQRKRVVHRQVYVPEKPEFINYASAFIDPYRRLKPILIDHEYSRKRKKSRQRRQKKPIPKDETLIPSEITEQSEPIDLWPLNPNNFDMDFIRQRQIAIDNSSYREVINQWQPSSIYQLVKLIKETFSKANRLDHVWMMFYWISQNITYDLDAKHVNAEEILRSGKTNCEGYASLVQILCEQININCSKIIGYAKDTHFHIHQTNFLQPNHTWNAVELEHNQWYLLDAAWGSGYIDSKFEYKQVLQPYYFLTRPETMIYNHLPKESRWQLLSKTISLKDYIYLPNLHAYYFLFDLTIVSPRCSHLVNFDSFESLAEILIQAPNDIQLSCSSKDDDHRSTCLTQFDSNRQLWQCLFAPYKSGFYTLVIYANRLPNLNYLFNTIELNVQISNRDFQQRKILPITYGKFLEAKCQIYSPLDRYLKSGTKLSLHCRVPQAIYGRITLDGNWFEEIEIQDEIFKQDIVVPQREIILYAQFSQKKSSNSYFALVRYLVDK